MKKFIVALEVGGVMEIPEIEYKNFQIIESIDSLSARNEYDRLNNCDYFYGKCFGEATVETVSMINTLYPSANLRLEE